MPYRVKIGNYVITSCLLKQDAGDNYCWVNWAVLRKSQVNQVNIIRDFTILPKFNCCETQPKWEDDTWQAKVITETYYSLYNWDYYIDEIQASGYVQAAK